MPRARSKKYLCRTWGNNLAKDVEHATSGHTANILVRRWGAYNSREYLSDDLWLEAYQMNKPVGNTDQMLMISEILKFRGVIQVAQAANTNEKGVIVIEIFGFGAHQYLPKDIANQVKGRLLEGELGL